MNYSLIRSFHRICLRMSASIFLFVGIGAVSVVFGASASPDSLSSLAALNRHAFQIATSSPADALREAHSSLLWALKDGNLREQARAYSTIGVVLRNQDQYDSALANQTRARIICEQIRDTLRLADVLLNIAAIYQSRGDYEGTMENCLQAQSLCDKYSPKGDKNNAQHNGESLTERRELQRITARVYITFGFAYALKGAFSKALEYQWKALQLRTELADKYAIAHSALNFGMLYEQMNRTDSALQWYHQALKQFESIGDIQGIALANGGLGSASERAGDIEKARQYHVKVIPMYEQLGDRRGLAVVHNSLASGFFQQKNYPQALLYADRAFSLATSIGALVEERDAMQHISNAYAAMGKESKSFAAFRLYVVLKDSLSARQNSQRIAELQGRYDLARKDRELQELEHQRTVERLNAASLRTTFTIATLVLVLVLGLVMNGYRIKRSSERLLRQQNEAIRQQQELLQVQSLEISQTNETLQRANERLGEINGELTERNAEKNEFLGIAAHDLKNPLTNILLTAQLIDDRYLEVPAEKLHDWTHGITRAAEYMLNIIGNLLDINKIEAGKVEMVIERVEASIVELIADAYNYRAVEKDLTLLVEQFAGDTVFLADRNALQQVLENLISNAIKFSPKGKNIIVRAKPSNHLLRIEIQDEGQGISADDMTKLFGKFARLTAQPTGGEHSTGLGLSIVKKMVEAMNGTVWCESEIGKGAMFIVELPVHS